MNDFDNLNIVLVGMPGAGKTFIGEKLAKLLVQFSYIDTDAEIEKRMTMKISDIFEKFSEKYFRELEKNIIEELSKSKNKIISIGGGAFQNEENIKALKKNGIIFYLQASPTEIYERIKNETQRPLLRGIKQPKQKLKNMLNNREKNYLKADITIQTDKRPAYTILDNIIGAYEKYDKQNTAS